jgi:cobalt transporter subunit CbtA
MLHRILAVAVVAGGLAGIAVTGLQMLWAVPLIHVAETYENAGAAPANVASHTHAAGTPAHGHGTEAGHGHAALTAEPWAPADGIERTAWTLIANLLIGVGGGLVLAAVFSLRRRADLTTGLAFGAVAFAAFGLAPALGLPPELPGTAAAELGARQTWWAGAAIATIGGLATAYYGRQIWVKAAGLLLLTLPHLIGAPAPEVHDALAPAALQREFIAASLVNSAVFWIVLGGLTGWLTRWLPDLQTETAGEPA